MVRHWRRQKGSTRELMAVPQAPPPSLKIRERRLSLEYSVAQARGGPPCRWARVKPTAGCSGGGGSFRAPLGVVVPMAARAPPPKRGAGTLAPSPLGQRRKPNNVDETPQPAAGARSAAAAAGQSAQNAQTEEAVNALLDAMDAGLTGGEELEPYPGALTVDLMTHQVSPLARHSSPEDAAGPPAPRTSPKPLKALRSPPHPSIPSQRVGLGWMMAKESSESAPRGGLLADDQGLGKTISTP